MKVSRILCAAFMSLGVLTSYSQSNVTISGVILDDKQEALPYVNVVLLTEFDSTFVAGTVSNELGRFMIPNVRPGNYSLAVFFVGYEPYMQALFVGSLSPFIDIATIELKEKVEKLSEIVITAQQDAVSDKLDKKTYSLGDNISQTGGSVLQALQNLPGVTIQDGKVLLRGNEKVTVLIDGKQTALTGFGSQSGLDNIPATAIDKIEIINNPSSKYDANGNAGIINIKYKKNDQQGLSGKAGIGMGLGALWIRKENLPTIRSQYKQTPKINPSLFLNYRRSKLNIFFQNDYLYTQTLNKNEFVTRTYDDGTIINQQTKRNRNTGFLTSKGGVDWNINDNNTLSLSGLFGSEKIIDRGDEPFFNEDFSERLRLWQFLEDELKTTVMANTTYQRRYMQAGHSLTAGFNYTFHREDEKYFFDNILPTFSGKDAFKLISDESVLDFTVDYVRPLKFGRVEAGTKVRRREIPTDMLFIPGTNSPLDTSAGGKATYKEIIPAIYGNYVFESKKIEAEIGVRVEYVKVNYEVDPNHNTYKSDGYHYSQPFPNVRVAYKINDSNKVSLFFNRRVDRPNEVDIRIFPKYDDAEIIKVGNPALQPQFTSSFELGYKSSWTRGYYYSALFHRMANGTITRIASSIPGSPLIYAIFQNVNTSFNTGFEVVLSQEINSWFSTNLNFVGYRNQIDGFTVENLYPQPNLFTARKEEVYSGNVKMNTTFHFLKSLDLQVTAVYLAPDIIPQGKINARFSLDVGMKKGVWNGKGELFLNANDILNSLIIRKDIQGSGFKYVSTDYYETQVFRMGFTYKF